MRWQVTTRIAAGTFYLRDYLWGSRCVGVRSESGRWVVRSKIGTATERFSSDDHLLVAYDVGSELTAQQSGEFAAFIKDREEKQPWTKQ